MNIELLAGPHDQVTVRPRELAVGDIITASFGMRRAVAGHPISDGSSHLSPIKYWRVIGKYCRGRKWYINIKAVTVPRDHPYYGQYINQGWSLGYQIQDTEFLSIATPRSAYKKIVLK